MCTTTREASSPQNTTELRGAVATQFDMRSSATRGDKRALGHTSFPVNREGARLSNEPPGTISADR